jgi:hypothetical protein
MNLTRIFPGKYPEVRNPDGTVSNVKTTVVGFDDGFYVLPTMRDGKQMTEKEAIDIAKKSGLKNYPRYNELENAVNFSKQIHDKIDKMGFLKK